MTSRTLLIRTDASVAIGIGHVMRCLALAQAWQDAGGTTVFVTVDIPSSVRSRLITEQCEVVDLRTSGMVDDANKTIAVGRERSASWIMLDGYHFSADYQRMLQASGFKLFVVDDYGHADRYSAELVLNQNVYANEAFYSNREPHTRLLLGTNYTLLRREFCILRDWQRAIRPIGGRLLISMGGSDPRNVTATLLEALGNVRDIEAAVVLGSSYQYAEKLQARVAYSGSGVQVHKNVSDMTELMRWADLAIIGAGSTCWEACLLQLPMALIDVSDNQTLIARALDKIGAAIHLGSAVCIRKPEVAKRISSVLRSASERLALSQSCGKLVDGLGGTRVLKELRVN